MMIVSKQPIEMIILCLSVLYCDFLVVTFGFDATQYNVLENATFVNVTIRQVRGGSLNRNVLITLQTRDGTAICK